MFGIDDNKDFYLILSYFIKGVCRCLEVLDGNKIVVGLVKMVVIVRYDEIFMMMVMLMRLVLYKLLMYLI